jgi:hypothetical protein
MSSVDFISPPFTDSQCPASNFSFSNASAPLFVAAEWIGAGIVPSANTNTIGILAIPLINVLLSIPDDGLERSLSVNLGAGKRAMRPAAENFGAIQWLLCSANSS